MASQSEQKPTAPPSASPVATAVDDLDALLAEVLPEASKINGLVRLSGGASRETWRFVADGRPLVVQLQRAGDERDMMVEAAVVKAAGAAGVPAPSMIASGRQSDGGAFMVVDAIDGETIARKIQRDDDFIDARRTFARRCGAALARLHAIDHADISGLIQEDQIERYTDVLDELGEPHPAFELARNWLLANRPAPTRTCLVHGDFRLGNLIVDSDGLRAVIDWELAHLGDPMEDLGWLCVKAWRFGGAHDVGGIGERNELFASYEAAGGDPVDPDAVHWWEVLGTWKWGIMCIVQADAHRSGRARSHELAAIGRRVCENEYDLLDPVGLNLFDLDPGQVTDPAGAELTNWESGPHDLPNAPELLQAVSEWIGRDVVETAAAAGDSRLRFHARVAMNVLATVERELYHGPVHAQRHRARLAGLGVESDRELADMIRAGIDDERTVEVATAVHASVLDKLAVANPKYASRAPG